MGLYVLLDLGGKQAFKYVFRLNHDFKRVRSDLENESMTSNRPDLDLTKPGPA